MENRVIEIHEFELYSTKERNQYVQLGHIQSQDLYNVIKEKFVEFIDNLESDTRNNRIVSMGNEFENKERKITFQCNDQERIVSGKIFTGKYGVEENVVDTNKNVVHSIKKGQAVEKPFYFMLCIPKTKDKGFLILERIGQIGIYQTFVALFHSFINHHFSNLGFNISYFVETSAIRKLISDERYNSISISRNYLPADIAERYGLERMDTQDYVIELNIKARGGKKLGKLFSQKIPAMLENKKTEFFTCREFNDLGFGKDSTVKVKAAYKNSERTINLTDTMKIRPYYDICVKLNTKGHSDFQSIENEAIELIQSLELKIN